MLKPINRRSGIVTAKASVFLGSHIINIIIYQINKIYTHNIVSPLIPRGLDPLRIMRTSPFVRRISHPIDLLVTYSTCITPVSSTDTRHMITSADFLDPFPTVTQFCIRRQPGLRFGFCVLPFLQSRLVLRARKSHMPGYRAIETRLVSTARTFEKGCRVCSINIFRS